MAGAFGIGSLACYDNLDQVGEGTYGYVYKARDIRSREPVALKRLIIHRETSGFPLNAVREIKFLKSLKHKNIVQLKDIATSKGCEHLEVSIKTDSLKADQQQDSDKNTENKKRKDQEGYNQAKDIMRICGNLYLVFEFIEHDIGGLIDSKYKFPVRAIKTIMKQLFEVLDYLSEKKIVHRDIKSSNILITNRHQIKLADFGLARSFQNTVDGRELKVDMTNNVITMWYRPPELLLGAVRYGPAIDMWSAGCVMAELELGRPLFAGKSEVEQLDLICRTLGTPGEDSWSGVSQLPQYEAMLKGANKYTSSLKTALGNKIPDVSLNLMERVLVFDPSRRSSAKIVLSNKYFLVSPLPPIDPADLEPLSVASGVSFHEYKTKQLRRQKEEEIRRGAEGGASTVTAENAVDDASKTTMTASGAALAVVGHPPPPPPPGNPPPPLPSSIAASVPGASASGYYAPAAPPASFPYSMLQPPPPPPPPGAAPYGYPYPVPVAVSYYPSAPVAAAAAPHPPPPPGPPPPTAAPPSSSSGYNRPVTMGGEWKPSVPPMHQPNDYSHRNSSGSSRNDYYDRSTAPHDRHRDGGGWRSSSGSSDNRGGRDAEYDRVGRKRSYH